MKKTIIFLLVLALALPTAALAATEFSLGGYIKLDTFWQSAQEYKGDYVIARNNDFDFHHGKLKFTAQESRFNFTIKGPKLWGATTTGFIEIDFDRTESGLALPGNGNLVGAANSASGSYTPGLRHAMFRLNWPETELLFGQYWSMLCEWWPELAQSGPFQDTGIPTARLAQIRVTQKFAGAWTVSALVGEANSVKSGRSFSPTENIVRSDRGGGESGEFPQIQGKVQYAQDLWGKAPYYGKPTPFTAQIVAGVQRNVFSPGNDAFGVINVNQFSNANAGVTGIAGIAQNTYCYPWIVMGTTFIPVIPTHSANLAGTASLMAQWYIGQGTEAFGFVGQATNILHWTGNDNWEYQLQKRFGGYIQGQYYFTNQWFLTGAYAMSRAFDVSVGQTDPNAPGNGRVYGLIGTDLFNYQHEFALCLWYRPIQALKFGLEYEYARTNYLINKTDANGNNPSKFGDAHRVEFCGYFYF